MSPLYLNLPPEQAESLKNYLLAHEGDIASDINDYGDLAYLFTVVIERVPKE